MNRHVFESWLIIATVLGGAGCSPPGDTTRLESEPTAAPVSLRIVNGCESSVDVYDSNSEFPVAIGLEPLQTSEKFQLAAGLNKFLSIRLTGASAGSEPLAVSPPLLRDAPAQGEENVPQGTVVLQGRRCSALLAWHGFNKPSPGIARVRFIDASYTSSEEPVRLYTERSGALTQVAAVSLLGDSGPEGVPLPVPRPGDQQQRFLVEASSDPRPVGVPGVVVPSEVFYAGAQLFAINVSKGILWLDDQGPLALSDRTEIPGLAVGNPTLAFTHAIPDFCPDGTALFTVADADGRAIASFELPFGGRRLISVPPADNRGYQLKLTPGTKCTAGEPTEVGLSPAGAGESFFHVLFGSSQSKLVRSLTGARGVPMAAMGSSLAFANIAWAAPELDLMGHTSKAPLVRQVAFGQLSPWQDVGSTDASVNLAAYAANAGAANIKPGRNLVALIGDYRNLGVSNLKLIVVN